VRLYSGPLSLFTAKVRIALDEKRLPYERVEVAWSLRDRYLPHHPDVAALNPKKQVPVLVDGDVVVYDSTQIFEYLEDRHPEPALYPRDAAGRARCRRLEAAADEQIFPPLWDLIEEAFYPAPAAGRDTTRRERALSAFAEHHRALDAELAGRSHLCDDFSVADIATFVMVHSAATLGALPAPEHRELAAWLDRVRARPAVRREVDAMTRFVAALLTPRPEAARGAPALA
jgi:glutathione S-transferase